MKTAREVLAELEQRGKPNTQKIYANHGVREKTVGLSFADLKLMVKAIGQNTNLAMALWKSRVHDARVLATKIADPDRLTPSTLDGWARDSRNYIISDALAGLAARRKDADRIARRWMSARDEWPSATGFQVLSILAMDGRLDPRLALASLDRIERQIRTSPNRTRHAMNNLVIAVGGSMPELSERALAVARSIGKVDVDHGQTGCKTPDATSYVQRMLERHQKAPKRTRVTAARTAAAPAKASKKPSQKREAVRAKNKPAAKAKSATKRSSTKASTQPSGRKAKTLPKRAKTSRAASAPKKRRAPATSGGSPVGMKSAREPKAGSIEVENVNVPGYVTTVNRDKYMATRRALEKVLPKRPPGLTQKEMVQAVLPLLPADLFPGGKTAMWWTKTVQLDLEAKGRIKRAATKPLRWHR